MRKRFLGKNVSVKGKKGKEKQQPRINKDASDRISGLPKAILHHIFSFLDMKQVVQTSVLSRRWRDLWTSLHTLNIDDKFWLNKGGGLMKNKFIDFVNKILLQRDGSNIQTFRLTWANVDNINVDAYIGHIDTWVTCVVRRNVQDLQLQVEYMPPLSSFSPSTTLKTLRLINATLPMQVEGSWCAPALESLIMEDCRHHYLEFLNISSPQLKYLVVKNNADCEIYGPSVQELKISAPNLTTLECKGYMYKDYCLKKLSSVVTAHIDTRMIYCNNIKEVLGSSLSKILRGLTGAKSLTLSVEGIQNFAEIPSLFKRGPISFPNLKYLKLEEWRDSGYIHALAKLLESFSCIEILVLEKTKAFYKSAKKDTDWGKQLGFDCMLSKLKLVEIHNLKGRKNEVTFIGFLLKNAMLLENIIITTTKVHSSDRKKELTEFSVKIRSLPRASSSAKISFLPKMET